MRWFDGHLDLSYVAQHGRDLTRPVDACGGSLQPASLTFPALRAGGVRAAVSTIFVRRRIADGPKPVDGPYCFDTPRQAFSTAQRQLTLYEKWEREHWIEFQRPTPQTPS